MENRYLNSLYICHGITYEVVHIKNLEIAVTREEILALTSKLMRHQRHVTQIRVFLEERSILGPYISMETLVMERKLLIAGA